MNNKALISIYFLILISISSSTYAARASTSSQLESIADLGRLNCRSGPLEWCGFAMPLYDPDAADQTGSGIKSAKTTRPGRVV